MQSMNYLLFKANILTMICFLKGVSASDPEDLSLVLIHRKLLH